MTNRSGNTNYQAHQIDLPEYCPTCARLKAENEGLEKENASLRGVVGAAEMAENVYESGSTFPVDLPSAMKRLGAELIRHRRNEAKDA